jgi:hypothetical protein
MPVQSSVHEEPASITPKLLVLDLNGTLVYRKKSSAGKRCYPRPYLDNFLECLFSPDAVGEVGNNGSDASLRSWEVFVWSSAMPHNVRGMVESTFGATWIQGVWDPEAEETRVKRAERGEGRVLGVWARDTMGLNAMDYGGLGPVCLVRF